jgi:hypothetical protein
LSQRRGVGGRLVVFPRPFATTQQIAFLLRTIVAAGFTIRQQVRSYLGRKYRGAFVLRVAVIAQTTGLADVSEQQRLALRVGDQVLRLTRLWIRDDRPICYEMVVLPLGPFPALASQPEVTDDIAALADAYGIPLGAAREDFAEAYPTAEVAEHLGINTDEAVFRIERIVRCSSGLPLEWRVAIFVELQEFGSGSGDARVQMQGRPR